MSNYKNIPHQTFASDMKLPHVGFAMFFPGEVSTSGGAAGVFAIQDGSVPYEEQMPEKMARRFNATGQPWSIISKH